METDERRFPGHGHAAPVAGSAGLVVLYRPRASEIDARPTENVIAFRGATVVLGREPPPGGVRVAETAASRLHARIAWTGGSWSLADLGSRNGTLVNGVRASETPLRTGDEIRIGDTLFKFVSEGIDAYRGARGSALPALVGGARIGRLAEELERVARSELSVLVLGESGTGKEVVARALHEASGRRGPLCAANTAAIPTALLESELFGHRRGAFSGADRDREGLIRAAHGGTLFLDEIGDMPLEAQAKLLRVLETREVVPLGQARGDRVDVRIVCATHCDLPRRIAEGRFRGDLYARIHGYGVRLPALRERKEDLGVLAAHFLAMYGGPDVRTTPALAYALFDYEWPYNVRELETALRRALAVANDEPLDVKHLPDELRERAARYGREAPVERASVLPPPSAVPVASPSAPPPADELRAMLERHRGNVSAVARELGKDRAQVHRWIVRRGVLAADFRESELAREPSRE